MEMEDILDHAKKHFSYLGILALFFYFGQFFSILSGGALSNAFFWTGIAAVILVVFIFSAYSADNLSLLFSVLAGLGFAFASSDLSKWPDNSWFYCGAGGFAGAAIMTGSLFKGWRTERKGFIWNQIIVISHITVIWFVLGMNHNFFLNLLKPGWFRKILDLLN